MLSSITPLGERGRGRRWGATLTWYLLASIAAGTVVGTASGAVGAAASSWLQPTQTWLVAVAAGAFALGALIDLRVAGLRPPGPARQVNEDWLTEFRGWVVGAGYGAQLGAGVTTIVPTAAVYLVWVLALLSASPVAGGLLGATFGLVRALPVLSAHGVRDAASLATLHRRLEALAPAAHRVVVGVQLLGAAGLTVTLVVP